ncbi:MAG: nitrilase-related carbon-nitrogen hydrolase, partial [Thermodesulfobacteriota bacterium]
AGRCALGVMICFEAERPDLARELAASGADALVIASNDAPLPHRAVGAEVAQARLRALETGLPVLRVANGGESLAIDRYGRVTARGDGVVALRAGVTPRLAPATYASRLLLGLCAALALCGVLSALLTPVRRRRRRGTASSGTRCRSCRSRG